MIIMKRLFGLPNNRNKMSQFEIELTRPISFRNRDFFGKIRNMVRKTV